MSVCTVPPLTFPLVAMADVERPVIPVIQEDMRTINQVMPNEGELRENTTNTNLKEDIKTCGFEEEREFSWMYLFQLEQ